LCVGRPCPLQANKIKSTTERKRHDSFFAFKKSNQKKAGVSAVLRPQKKVRSTPYKPEGTERDNQLQKKRGALKFPFFFAAGIAL
jgi:hypothetical protein